MNCIGVLRDAVKLVIEIVIFYPATEHPEDMNELILPTEQVEFTFIVDGIVKTMLTVELSIGILVAHVNMKV